MYKKQIKIKGKKYNYYYHNFKVNGKVKNICLGDNRKEAMLKLEKLMHKDIKESSVNNSLQNIYFKNSIRVFLIMFVFVLGIGLLYFIKPEITGLSTYNTEIANIVNIVNKFKIKELLGLVISLELMFFGYTIYNDYKHKVKII